MSYNIYDEELQTLQLRLHELSNDQQRLMEQQKAFQAFDLEQQQSKLQSFLANLQTAELDLSHIMKELEEATLHHTYAKIQAAAGLDPLNWFSSRRAVAKRLLASSTEKKNALTLKARAMEKDITHLRNTAGSLEQRITQHRGTNFLELCAKLKAFETQLSTLRKELPALESRKSEIDRLIHEQVAVLQQLTSKRARLLSDIRQAEQFESKLQGASNSYERKCIHDDCEKVLGSAKPGVVISRCKSELRGVESSIEKLEKAIKLAVSRASVTIEALVLDGSNLCNTHDNQFMGLRGLDALVPVLLKKYRVTLVFDPGIHQKLKITEAQLKARFPKTELYVLKNKKSADETLLNSAQHTESTYIISRDKFIDYPHMAAVKQERVLDFTVLNNTIVVDSLNISAPLKMEEMV